MALDMFQYARNLIQKHHTHDVEEILDALGICIHSFPMHGIRGLYKWLDGWPTVFVDSGLEYHERQFVLAHELAHFLFHRGQNRVFLDRRTYLKTDRYEKEADLFAACFLHPFPESYFYDGVTVQEISHALSLDEPAAELYCQEFQKHAKNLHSNKIKNMV